MPLLAKMLDSSRTDHLFCHCISTVSWKQLYPVSNKICCMFQIITFQYHESVSCRHLTIGSDKQSSTSMIYWHVLISCKSLKKNLSNHSVNYCEELPLKNAFSTPTTTMAFTQTNKMVFPAITEDIKDQEKREKNARTRQIHMEQIALTHKAFQQETDIYFGWNPTGSQHITTYTYPVLPPFFRKMPECHETHNNTTDGTYC